MKKTYNIDMSEAFKTSFGENLLESTLRLNED